MPDQKKSLPTYTLYLTFCFALYFTAMQVLHVRSSRSVGEECLINDFLLTALACLDELCMYGLYLQSCPSKAAALIAHVEQGSREERTQSQIMSDMRQEWKWILQMEESSQMNAILRKWCPFLAHYQVREIHSVLMEEKWSFSERSKQLLLSWFPKYSFSSNIEDLFNSLEDGLRRGVKNNKTSLSNMQCIAIRSLQH